MHPLLHEALAQEHIHDLHREAAIRRLGRSSQKRKVDRRKAAAPRLQRAPAH